jgi:hypothetical protein
LSLLRGSAGCAAFPNVGPSGGSLLGLNVIVSSAAQVDSGTNRIALLSPAEIYWTGEGMVQLRVSQAAALEMTDPVTGDPAELVSMWQTNSTAVRAIHEAAWYARPNSQAFVTVPY